MGEPKHKEESKKGSIDFLEDPMTSSDKGKSVIWQILPRIWVFYPQSELKFFFALTREQ